MNELLNLIPKSGIRKFFDLVLESEDVISLGVGEPDFITPWNIREGAIFSLEKGYTTYSSNQGVLELRQMLSGKIKKETNATYCPEKEIMVTVGVSEGLDLALRALLNPKDEVIIPEPCFVSYKPMTILNNGIPVMIKKHEENNFMITAQDINEKVTKKTKAIILNSPNNPTGGMLDKRTMQNIYDIALENNIFIISDEIYSDLVYDEPFTSFASFDGIKDNLVLLNGFSKSYAMTGLRLGYAAAPPKVLEAMNKIHQYSIMCAPTTSQMAAIEALKNGTDDMQKMKNEYNRRRNIIVKGFNDMGLRCNRPKGAFYAFPNITSTGLSSEKFCENLLKEQNVAAVPGNAFGSSGEGFIRCSYAASMEEIRVAIDRIKKFV